MFKEVFKGLIPVFVIVGALTFALAPIDNPVFDAGRVSQSIGGR